MNQVTFNSNTSLIVVGLFFLLLGIAMLCGSIDSFFKWKRHGGKKKILVGLITACISVVSLIESKSSLWDYSHSVKLSGKDLVYQYAFGRTRIIEINPSNLVTVKPNMRNYTIEFVTKEKRIVSRAKDEDSLRAGIKQFEEIISRKP